MLAQQNQALMAAASTVRQTTTVGLEKADTTNAATASAAMLAMMQPQQGAAGLSLDQHSPKSLTPSQPSPVPVKSEPEPVSSNGKNKGAPSSSPDSKRGASSSRRRVQV
jgi:hypothetical protein